MIMACPAGRFGFQREMNALETLKTGQDSEDAANVAALLQSTHEIELRTQQVNRWFRLWRRDVRDGWLTLGRFRVAPSSKQADVITAGKGYGSSLKGPATGLSPGDQCQ